jgi:predicted O-methyltransferase YrrM
MKRFLKPLYKISPKLMLRLSMTKTRLKMALPLGLPAHLPLLWERRASWLCANLPEGRFAANTFRAERTIEKCTSETQRLGGFLPHEIYGKDDLKREAQMVRPTRGLGRFYRWLVVNRKPEVVVEFGSAFGHSGMCWLAGLEENAAGELFTFEVNPVLQKIAAKNLVAIGSRFRSFAGYFEDRVDETIQNRKIDIALIDAVHTSAWVLPQFDIVVRRMRPGGIVIVDDIALSDDMQSAWKTIAHDRRGVAAVAVDRTGVFEVAN